MRERGLSRKEKLAVLWASLPQLHAALEKERDRAERAEQAFRTLQEDYKRIGEVLACMRRELDEVRTAAKKAEQTVVATSKKEDDEEVTMDEIMTEWTEGAKDER